MEPPKRLVSDVAHMHLALSHDLQNLPSQTFLGQVSLSAAWLERKYEATPDRKLPSSSQFAGS
jgi:hypothetical protein